MKHYPSINGPFDLPSNLFQLPCHVFVKYDGSNLRAEWSKKNGWHKFGTRKRLIEENDPIFGIAFNLFKAKYGDGLEQIFRSCFKKTESFIVFFEFFGSKSFAGLHFPDDIYDVVLFDVNPVKKGILGPKEFLETFGSLNVAELLFESTLTQELIESIRTESVCVESKLSVKSLVPEGVICKGGEGHKLWMCKIKTDRYKQELKNRFQGSWEEFWE
jgi:hypothetical protein